MEEITLERKVNYYETDKMAIVHHSNYIRYFEEARLFFLEKHNCSFADMEEEGLIIPNVDAYAKYIKTLKYGDEFYVKVHLSEFNGVKIRFEYELYNKEGDVLSATGYTTHCFVKENYHPISIRKSHKNLYERMMKLLEE